MRHLVIASLTIAAVTHANGRPPLTNGVFFQHGDPHSLYVRSTFGLLVSHDDGCSFRWTCEQNIGYGGMYDPSYAIASDATLFATGFHGLRVSRDRGCSFTTATADVYVDAVDIGAPGEVWIATADVAKANDVFRSTDGGATFVSRGMSSPVRWWNSVVVSPSDPQHVYVSGYEVASGSPIAHVFATTDGGQMWREGALAGVQLGATPLLVVAAVDPANAQRLFVESVGANGSGDRLYRSIDGGMTFTEVLTTTQPITNVVIRDAMTVLVAGGTGGSFRSDDAGVTFAPIANAPELACLGQRADGTLVGCGTNWDPDFMAVAVSGDGAQWQKLFRFIELDGTLACPPGTIAHDVCDEQMWPTMHDQFGVTGPTCATATDLPDDRVDGAPPKPAGCCDAGGAPPIGPALVALAMASIFRRRSRKMRG